MSSPAACHNTPVMVSIDWENLITGEANKCIQEGEIIVLSVMSSDPDIHEIKEHWGVNLPPPTVTPTPTATHNDGTGQLILNKSFLNAADDEIAGPPWQMHVTSGSDCEGGGTSISVTVDGTFDGLSFSPGLHSVREDEMEGWEVVSIGPCQNFEIEAGEDTIVSFVNQQVGEGGGAGGALGGVRGAFRNGPGPQTGTSRDQLDILDEGSGRGAELSTNPVEVVVTALGSFGSGSDGNDRLAAIVLVAG